VGVNGIFVTMKEGLKYKLMCLCFISMGWVHAQNFVLPEGEFMDTTHTHESQCPDLNVYYYSVGGKYPVSSATLLKQVQDFMGPLEKTYTGSGYITFRFRVNCKGSVDTRVQVLQTNENYESYHFDKGLVNTLYSFIKTLNQWKIAKNQDNTSFSYITILSFKIKNGKVIRIIP
jgi:hypothetical protein